MNPAKYQQKADHACGASCVRIVLDHFGKRPPSERTLLKILHADFKTGIEPWRMALYLEGKGFDAVYKCESGFTALRKRFEKGWIPIICWMDWDGHYCVVTTIDSHMIRLADPAASYDDRPDGSTITSTDRFKAMWSTPHTRNLREVIYVRAKDSA
jgi:ABC-type bacteriocin/lantibiotic exporter with double-glycine peptidase domain